VTVYWMYTFISRSLWLISIEAMRHVSLARIR
jgi:hypothetical protein